LLSARWARLTFGAEKVFRHGDDNEINDRDYDKLRAVGEKWELFGASIGFGLVHLLAHFRIASFRSQIVPLLSAYRGINRRQGNTLFSLESVIWAAIRACRSGQSTAPV
jgi:hypothetical protein